MNNRTRNLDRILGITLFLSILACSFGRGFINVEFANYFFWLSLGFYLGFQLYKYEIKRMWKNEQKD